MKINVKRIPIDGEDLRGEEPASIMELDDESVQFEHEVRYAFHAQVQGNALLVTGRVWTPVTLRCGRCLQTFTQPLRADNFVVHRELHGEDFVDLTANIREDMILELPQRALCAEDCKGLCPDCGKDLNKGACSCERSPSDRRWQALDRIRLK